MRRAETVEHAGEDSRRLLLQLGQFGGDVRGGLVRLLRDRRLLDLYDRNRCGLGFCDRLRLRLRRRLFGLDRCDRLWVGLLFTTTEQPGEKPRAWLRLDYLRPRIELNLHLGFSSRLGLGRRLACGWG